MQSNRHYPEQDITTPDEDNCEPTTLTQRESEINSSDRKKANDQQRNRRAIAFEPHTGAQLTEKTSFEN